MSELSQKMQGVLTLERDNAFLSLELATVITDLEVGFSIDDGYMSSSERIMLPSFVQFLAKMEFHSLLKQFGGAKNSSKQANVDDSVSTTTQALSAFPPARNISDRDTWMKSIHHMNTSVKIWLSYEVFSSYAVLVYSDGVASYSVTSSVISSSELLEVLVSWVLHPSITLYAGDLKYVLRSLEIFSQGMERSMVEEVFSC